MCDCLKVLFKKMTNKLNNKITILLLMIISLIILVELGACSDSIITSNKDIVFPDSNVSFQNHVQPFLQITCALQGCHSAESMAAGRRIDDYFYLWETYNNGLVISGNPDASRLVQILKGNPLHLGLYFPKGYFSENEINGISSWVRDSARYN